MNKIICLKYSKMYYIVTNSYYHHHFIRMNNKIQVCRGWKHFAYIYEYYIIYIKYKCNDKLISFDKLILRGASVYYA